MRQVLPLCGCALLLAAGSSWAQQAPVAAPAQLAPSFSAQPISVDGRLERLERVVNSQALTELLVLVEQLQLEIQQLRGEIELQSHDINGLKQRQKDLYVDVDRRMRRLELASTQPIAPPTSNLPPTVTFNPTTTDTTSGSTPPVNSGSSSVTLAADPAEERKSYQQAFSLLKEGRYAMAIEAFRSFISSYPEGSYADNAQYWLGEARYVTRDFANAISEFHQVLEKYPESPKIPDAMLKIGYARFELGEQELAGAVLADIIQRYPESTAARLADKRLQRIKRETP